MHFTMKIATTAALALILQSPIAKAESWNDLQNALAGNLEWNGGVSSLGAFVETSYRMSDNLQLRAPFYWGKIDKDISHNQNDFDATIKSVSGGFVADYYPTGSGFFFSGGLMLGGYKAKANTDTFTANNVTYTGDFDARIKPEHLLEPQVSIGYRHASKNHLLLTAEAGIRVAKYKMKLTGAEGLDATAQANIQSEVDSINDDLSDYPVTPFINLGIGWSF